MKNFYKNKTVLVTGHTGFKGAYLSHMLLGFGANVIAIVLNHLQSHLCLRHLGLKIE